MKQAEAQMAAQEQEKENQQGTTITGPMIQSLVNDKVKFAELMIEVIVGRRQEGKAVNKVEENLESVIANSAQLSKEDLGSDRPWKEIERMLEESNKAVEKLELTPMAKLLEGVRSKTN